MPDYSPQIWALIVLGLIGLWIVIGGLVLSTPGLLLAGAVLAVISGIGLIPFYKSVQKSGKS